MRHANFGPARSKRELKGLGHSFEAVVKVFPAFWLLEKFGEAGEIAEDLARLD